MTNQLYYGDNLAILRAHVADASVDLIYLDPPFNSNASYNILVKSPAGRGADAASRRSTTPGTAATRRKRRSSPCSKRSPPAMRERRVPALPAGPRTRVG